MRPGTHTRQDVPSSLVPEEGWHCLHLYYRFERAQLRDMDSDARQRGIADVQRVLDENALGLERVQAFVVAGHKADFGVMAMDPDPLKLDRLSQALSASPLGPALVPTYSFVSVSEISEYVPSIDEYRARLVAAGADPTDELTLAKVKAYEAREPEMRRQRLTPDFPDWPSMCFYPMNKKRVTGENWFSLPKSARSEMMTEHARSGMAFAGKVTQLITVSVGLDDWEWGVTLWARNPQYLKDIVYRMRFDEASARYAEFGPFYTGYILSAGEILHHCRVSV